MSVISVEIVFAFYKCAPILPKFIGKKLEQLGIATYGIYLLHPIVLDFTRAGFEIISLDVKYIPTIFAIAITIFVAFFIYKFIEAPCINLGKRITLMEKDAVL